MPAAFSWFLQEIKVCYQIIHFFALISLQNYKNLSSWQFLINSDMALIRSVRGFTPVFGDDCFLAETAVVIGEVTMGKGCSVWYNAVVRGDVNSIRIGDFSNIQDGAVIHGTFERSATVIGNHVSIGHNALVHGCTVEDHVLIGMGAIIMDDAVIGKGSFIAAGAVVLQGTRVEPGMLYAGVPAKPVRAVDEKLRHIIDRTSLNYPRYASWFKEDSAGNQ